MSTIVYIGVITLWFSWTKCGISFVYIVVVMMSVLLVMNILMVTIGQKEEQNKEEQ